MSFLNALDYSQLQMNVVDLPATERAIDAFPSLQNIPEMKKFWAKKSDLNREVAIRYMILLYSKNSPLFGMYPKIEVRKEKAYGIVSQVMGKSLNNSLKPAITDFTDIEFTSLVVGFCRYYFDRDWQMVVSLEQMLDEYHKRIMLSITTADDKDMITALERKDKLMNALEKYTVSLDGYYQRISSGDKIIEDATRKQIMGMITPEMIADKLAEVEDV